MQHISSICVVRGEKVYIASVYLNACVHDVAYCPCRRGAIYAFSVKYSNISIYFVDRQLGPGRSRLRVLDN